MRIGKEMIAKIFLLNAMKLYKNDDDKKNQCSVCELLYSDASHSKAKKILLYTVLVLMRKCFPHPLKKELLFFDIVVYFSRNIHKETHPH